MSLQLPQDLTPLPRWKLEYLANHCIVGTLGRLRGAASHYTNLLTSIRTEMHRRIVAEALPAAEDDAAPEGEKEESGGDAPAAEEEEEDRRSAFDVSREHAAAIKADMAELHAVEDPGERGAAYLDKLLAGCCAPPHSQLDTIVRRIWATTRQTPWCEKEEHRSPLVARRTLDNVLVRVWKKIRAHDPEQVIFFLVLRDVLPHTIPFCVAYD